MKIDAANPYPADVEAVAAAMGDPGFLTARAEALGHTPVEILESEARDDGWRIVIRRRVPLTVPRFARKVLTPRAIATQTEDWRRSEHGYRGEFEVKAAGIPGHVAGTATLEPDGMGTVHRISAEVTADVPVIGAKIAKLLADDTLLVIRSEHEFGVAHFGGDG
jgi:hypothetical protein